MKGFIKTIVAAGITIFIICCIILGMLAIPVCIILTILGIIFVGVYESLENRF